MSETTIDLEKLKEPFTPKWRIQSIKNSKAICVPYIDARDAQERLDKVCTPALWQNVYEPESGSASIGIYLNNDWVWKGDVGTETKVESIKGKASDAFKRACVPWGIGRELYKIDPVVLEAEGKFAKTKDGTILYTGAQLTNYINGINTSQGLLMQIVKNNPGLNDNKSYQDHVKGLLAILKAEGK